MVFASNWVKMIERETDAVVEFTLPIKERIVEI
jgi:hypothetical protein